MKVWVVGAGGRLGRAVVDRLAAWDVDHVASGREVDVRDPTAARRFLAAAGCDLVVNCAAYTRVDDAEREPEAARALNVDGPANLGAAAAAAGAALVHVSTDYVFSGTAGRPCREDDAPAPLNTYGRTKLAGERAALASGARCHVLRTSWLFGGRGDFVATMLALLRERDELRVVADQRGRPTYCRDLAEAALRLAGVGPTEAAAAPPGVYQFANAGVASWYEFAAAIRDEALRRGLSVATRTLVPITAAELPRPARRPAWSVLDTAKLEAALARSPRPWRHALAAHFDDLSRS